MIVLAFRSTLSFSHTYSNRNINHYYYLFWCSSFILRGQVHQLLKIHTLVSK